MPSAAANDLSCSLPQVLVSAALLCNVLTWRLGGAGAPEAAMQHKDLMTSVPVVRMPFYTLARRTNVRRDGTWQPSGVPLIGESSCLAARGWQPGSEPRPLPRLSPACALLADEEDLVGLDLLIAGDQFVQGDLPEGACVAAWHGLATCDPLMACLQACRSFPGS